MTGALLVDRDAAIEAELAAAVVDTLLREDYAGLAGRVRVTGVAVAPTADADGVAAFGAECQQALATLRLRERHLVGDVVAFGLAGAYAWNISHYGFLMHPPPAFHYLP